MADTEAGMTTQMTDMARAMMGAEICVAHWEIVGDDELLAEAVARIGRLTDGTATEEDILGAYDWADLRGEAETVVSDRDAHHTVASRIAEMVVGGCDYDEMAQRLADTYEEWGCEVSEALRLANEHLTAEIG